MTTEAKFTAGPWIAAPYSSAVGAPVVAANGRSVAKVTYYALADEGFANHERESEANGHLIAAAPDLLEVVEAFEAFYPSGINLDLDKASDKARAALAKARGA